MRAVAFTGRRPAHPFARPADAASLIAIVATLAMLGQGDFTAPPRYDGAGYAVLARSLAAGTGYRAIDHPDRPRHAHFPPGYPILLALVWSLTGPSALAAHLVSCLCTIGGATLAAWWWFRRIYPQRYGPGAGAGPGSQLGLGTGPGRRSSQSLSTCFSGPGDDRGRGPSGLARERRSIPGPGGPAGRLPAHAPDRDRPDPGRAAGPLSAQGAGPWP